MELDQEPYVGTESSRTAALVDAYLESLLQAREAAVDDRTFEHAFALLAAIYAGIDVARRGGRHQAALVEACFEALGAAWTGTTDIARALALGTALRRTVAL